MIKVLVADPASYERDGWHPVYGDAEDALAGNVSRVFLTGVPQSVPTTLCKQPDDWSCGAYALAECLGQGDGEDARNWLINHGKITSAYGTEYDGIVGYLNSCGYSCEYDGRAYDGVVDGAIFEEITNHLKAGYKVILCMHGTRKGCRTNYYTYGGHYLCVYGIHGEGDGIAVDGFWGNETTEKAQQVFGTQVDKIVSNQSNLMIGNLPNCSLASWEFVHPSELKNGSELVRAIQTYLGIKPSGFFDFQTISAFQAFLGVEQDGYVGGDTVCAWQRWLNEH